MSKAKQYILIGKRSIATAEVSHSYGEILTLDEYKALPKLFQKHCEVFDEGNKKHLNASQSHVSPEESKKTLSVEELAGEEESTEEAEEQSEEQPAEQKSKK